MPAPVAQHPAEGVRLLASRALAPPALRARVLSALDMAGPVEGAAGTEAIAQMPDGTRRSCIVPPGMAGRALVPGARIGIDPADGSCRPVGGVAASPAIR